MQSSNRNLEKQVQKFPRIHELAKLSELKHGANIKWMLLFDVV